MRFGLLSFFEKNKNILVLLNIIQFKCQSRLSNGINIWNCILSTNLIKILTFDSHIFGLNQQQNINYWFYPNKTQKT